MKSFSSRQRSALKEAVALLKTQEESCLERVRKQLSAAKVATYQRDGYAVFPEVYDEKTISLIKERMAQIVEEVDLAKDRATEIAIFSTENSNRQLRDDYFLDSAWQIKPFFESDAVDGNGKLLVDKSVAFNK